MPHILGAGNLAVSSVKIIELCIILLLYDNITGGKLSIMLKYEAVLQIGIR